MRILIETKPHAQQRYPTIGDWWFEGRDLHIVVSEELLNLTDGREYVALVGLHELVEALLCKRRRIPESSVTVFDVSHEDAEEPGDLEDAPYHQEHVTATHLERLFADALDINWDNYDWAVKHVGNETT